MARKQKIIDMLIENKILSDKKVAEAHILAGKIKVNGKLVKKPGDKVDTGSEIRVIKGKEFVSRGGHKLKGAVKDFGIKIKGKDAIDIGVSTGGFTDFLLQSGINRVIAIDVAYGTIDWKLRNDSRVHLFERQNFRKMNIGKLPFKADIVVADVSFISLRKLIGKILGSAKEGADILLLFKPQFEAERYEVGEGGIIKDPNRHKDVLKTFLECLYRLENIKFMDISYSHIKGIKGNIEYWIYLKKTVKEAKTEKKYDKMIQNVVEKAHNLLNQRQGL